MSQPSQIDDMLEYMRCCILAHSPRDIEQWGPEKIHAVFLTIPTSFADFDVWHKKLNPAAVPAVPMSESTAAPYVPTPEEQAEIDRVNDAAIAALKQENPELAKRFDSEDAARREPPQESAQS